MDADRHVKFENLKYDLKELFDHQPDFDEPLPLYGQMYDFVPKKLEFPYKQRFEGAPDQKPKANKH